MRNIPDDNLAYPVFIQVGENATGSGFLLSATDNLYLVTARHVLYGNNGLKSNSVKLTCQTKDVSDDRTIVFKLDLNVQIPMAHNTADVAAVHLGLREKIADSNEYNVHLNEGIQIVGKGKFNTVSVKSETSTKLLAEVLVSNDVFVYGYPTSLGLKNSPQFDFNKPLLRKGIVANIYPKQGTIILDCPVYYGNSGGPVVEVEHHPSGNHHHVIGVVSQFIPYVQQWHNPPSGIVNTEFHNSGYSVAVSMDKVFEIIGYKK